MKNRFMGASLFAFALAMAPNSVALSSQMATNIIYQCHWVTINIWGEIYWFASC